MYVSKMAFNKLRCIRTFLFVNGIVMIVTGIIVGRKIIEGVGESIAKKNCVTSKTHPDYEKWVSNQK